MVFDKNDSDVTRELERNPRRDVAVIGILNSRKEILLVKTRRFPNHWQPPGGGVKGIDKSPMSTVMREVKEEVGLDLSNQKMSLAITTDYDFGEGKVYFYVVYLAEDTTLEFNSSELVEWRWLRLDDTQGLKVFPATQKFLKHLKSEFGC